MDPKRARLGMVIGVISGLMVLYAIGWIAGVHELRHLSDWRGPFLAFLIAIAVPALLVIRQIQAIE